MMRPIAGMTVREILERHEVERGEHDSVLHATEVDVVEDALHVVDGPEVLELDDRLPVRVGDQVEELIESRHAGAAVALREPRTGIESPDTGQREVGDTPVAVRGAIDGRIVHEHGLMIGGELHIGLEEVEVVGERRAESRHGVLRRPGAVTAVPGDERRLPGGAQRTHHARRVDLHGIRNEDQNSDDGDRDERRRSIHAEQDASPSTRHSSRVPRSAE